MSSTRRPPAAWICNQTEMKGNRGDGERPSPRFSFSLTAEQEAPEPGRGLRGEAALVPAGAGFAAQPFSRFWGMSGRESKPRWRSSSVGI